MTFGLTWSWLASVAWIPVPWVAIVTQSLARGDVPALGHLSGQLGCGVGVPSIVSVTVAVPDQCGVNWQADEADVRVGAVGQDLVAQVRDVPVGRGPASRSW